MSRKKRTPLTSAEELRRALKKSSNRRCPIKTKPPPQADLYDVPRHLRNLACFYEKARRGVDVRAQGIESVWQSDRLHAIEFVLTDSIRKAGRHGQVNIEMYKNWKYAVSPV